MNAPLRIAPARTYWHPLTVTAASIGARVEPMQHGHEVWHMGDVTMLVRIINGVPHALDVCGTADAPFTGWVKPRRPFSAASVARALPPSDWAHEQYMREVAAERRACDREDARDARRREWRETSFQIE